MLVSQKINHVESFCQKRIAFPEDAAVIAEIAGISDQDEVERLVTRINELDRNYIFEVGGCLLRLKEVWQPSDDHPDFDSFCLARLGKRYSETHRNDLINAAKLQQALPETAVAVLGDSLNATKPLYSMLHRKVEPEKIQEVIEEVASTGSVTRESVEQAAIAKGYLPPKREKKQQREADIAAQGQAVGLSGKEKQQLPDIEPNADIPPDSVKPLVDCVTMNDVVDAILASPKTALDEFQSATWQERIRLRGLCSDIYRRFRLLESDEFQVGAMLTFLELADKDSKIEWQASEILRLQRENEALRRQLGQWEVAA